MSDPSGAPPRPTTRPPIGERVARWVQWFGLGRLVTGALSVAVVVAGAAWLLRAPAPTTEAGLPMASAPATSSSATAAGATPGSTLPSSSVPVTAPSVIVVHVAGAVVAPGVYDIASSARAADAIVAAGGAAADAELDAVNLAAPVSDGQRLYVPHAGEVDPAQVIDAVPTNVTSSVTTPSGPIDLNTATAAELETLPGVGPATAAAIVDDRQRNGPFATVDDLDRVPGIGAAKLAALRDSVTV